MRLILQKEAIKWFKEEMGLKPGENIKFHVQSYGKSPVQPSFSLGFSKDNRPINIAASTEEEGVLFFIEESDLWYFDGHDLEVDFNETKDELVYKYVNEKERAER